jgi:hypothetical protein
VDKALLATAYEALQSSYEMAKNNIKAAKERNKEYDNKNVDVPLFPVRDFYFQETRYRIIRSL